MLNGSLFVLTLFKKPPTRHRSNVAMIGRFTQSTKSGTDYIPDSKKALNPVAGAAAHVGADVPLETNT
jgi:hypothetical protein